MDDKIKILLDKINIDKDSYQYFNDAKITRIVVSSKNNCWNIYIKKDTLLPVNILEELESKKYLLDEKSPEITLIWDIENPDINIYLSYYPLILKKLKDKLKVTEIYEDCLKVEDGFLVLVAGNEMEQERLNSVVNNIENFYRNLSYKFNMEVIIKHEGNILSEIQNELNNEVNSIEIKEVKKSPEKEIKQESPEKKYRKEAKDPNSVIGRGIKDDPIKIKTLIGEDNNVTVEAQVFGTDYFESSKTDFKIITLKITDYSDSIYCKVFVRDDEEYSRLCKEFKAGNWYKIRGYTKNDQFSKELVLNARDVIKIEKQVDTIKDTAEEKRVELHCHTKMSQMDGLCDEVDVVKQAMKWGMKAVAITDHNGVQAFPHVFNFVKVIIKN